MSAGIVGRSEVAPGEAKCIDCGEPFKGGPKGAPDVNVYSKDGMREVAITGMCECCFDALMEDDLEEEIEAEPFSGYCECNAEPTINELEDGRCDACGRGIA